MNFMLHVKHRHIFNIYIAFTFVEMHSFLDIFKHFEMKPEFCNIILTFCFNEKYNNKRIIILSMFMRIFQWTF